MEDRHSSASILRISDEKTLQLIELYRQEECLWNSRIEDYRTKWKRSESAQRVADALNIPEFGPRHVIMKFKNLRNSYSQELKKIAKSKVEGDGCYKPSVFWFSKMDAFIRPHLQPPRGGFHSMVHLFEGTEAWTEFAMPDSFPQTELTEVVTPSGSDNDSREPRKRKRKTRSTTKNLLKRQKTDSESDDQSYIKSNENSTEDQQKTIVNALKDLAADVHLLMSQKEDYFDSFGKYVAGLLRSIPRRKALEVQPQIISLITSAGCESESQGSINYYCDASSVEVKVEKL